jgi:hypothetical protein
MISWQDWDVLDNMSYNHFRRKNKDKGGINHESIYFMSR